MDHRRIALRAGWALALVAALAGCERVSESRFNPFNWFGRDQASDQRAVGSIDTDPRPVISEVVAVSLDKAPGGVILTAVGRPERQGYWSGALLPQEGAAGVLVFQFRIAPPPGATRVGTPRSRDVTVGRFVSDQSLRGVREIRVLGSTASRAVRR